MCFRTGSALFHLLASIFHVSVATAVASELSVSSDTASEIARRYQAGETQAAIASSLGLGRSVVRRVLDQQAVAIRPRFHASGPHQEAILALHADGKSIREISTRLEIDFATVYRVLRRARRVQKKCR
jgi:DNA-binding transcriptional regulator LsrR (DeoR family)